MGDTRNSLTAGLILAGLMGTAAAVAAPDCSSESRAVGEVVAVAEGIIAADNARDLPRVLACYSDDAVLLPPGEDPVTGLDSIRPRYEGLFSGFDPRIEGHIEEACVEGGTAFVRGRNGGALVSRKDGTVRELNDTYLMILRRDGEGRWRISRLMWHGAGSRP